MTETRGRRIYVALQLDYLTCSWFCGMSLGTRGGNVGAVEELILVWFPKGVVYAEYLNRSLSHIKVDFFFAVN